MGADDPNPEVPAEQRSKARKLLDQGVTAYPEILQFLADYIFPDEASEAETAARRAISVLYGTAISLALLACLPSTIPFKDDLLAAASLVAALVLVSRYRVSFAGRLLLVPAALLTFHTPSYATWQPLDDAGESLDVLFASLALACLFDFGASTEPERKRPRIRKLVLLLVGAGCFAAALDHDFPITCGASLLTCLWGWWPAPRLEQQSRPSVDDADILWLLAMRRWSFVAWGRIFAVIAAMIPFFLFLHSLGLEDRLEWPKDDEEIVKTKVDGTTQAWFWQPRGSYLKISDLRTKQFYGFRNDGWDKVEDLRMELADANRGEGERTSRRIYGEIKEELKGHRIMDAASFKDLVAGGVLFKLYHLEEPKPGQKSSAAQKLRRLDFVVEDLTAGVGAPLVAVDADQVKRLMQHNGIWQWLLLGYGLLGFVILWRRGGDSRLGRWIGLWFIALGTLGMVRYVDFFLPALNYQVSHQSDLPTETLINLMVLVAVVVVALFVLFVICGAIWTHACWPSARPNGPRRWLGKLLMFCKISLVTGCMIALYYAPWIVWEEEPSLAVMCGVTLFPCVSFAVGLLLRKRASVKANQIPISLSAGFVLLAIHAIVVTTVLAEEFENELPAARLDDLKYASLVSGLLFLLFIAHLIFKKDFLHLSAVRDFSLVVTAMVVPLMLAWSEELSSSYVSFFAENLISTRGKEVLAVVLAVGLLPPLRRLIERRVLYATRPRLRGLERSLQETLEGLFELWQPESFGRIEEILRQAGVEGLILYVRQGKDSFRAVQPTGEAAVEFEVSAPLRSFLARNRGFHDLRRLAFEWRYFFVQFELYRIRQKTQGCFLLPVCLGGSVRALLSVPLKTPDERLDEALAGDIAQLGLIATQFRAAGRSSEAA